MSRYGGYPAYVPVAVRREKALKKMEKLRKKGQVISPVQIEGKKIAKTFWGKAWCDHLEDFSDYENRLPRGRTYVRNGSVCHLAIESGKITAMVSGSSLYKIEIIIEKLAAKKWKKIKKACAGKISSLLGLLKGELSKEVMAVVTDAKNGLFPLVKEIKLGCNCPDWATMCKHVAAVLYGVGARLDNEPELLFTLRAVDHKELIETDIDMAIATKGSAKNSRIKDDALSDIFGIDMIESSPASTKAIAKKMTKKFRKHAKGTAKEILENTKKIDNKKPAKPRQPTGKTLARVRKSLGLNKMHFAQLLDISLGTVTNWEAKPGALKLNDKRLVRWLEIRKFTPAEVTAAVKNGRWRGGK